MCIAIYKKENVVIPKEILAECYKRNSDGAGFMYNDGGKLKIKKGYFTFDSFYHEFQKVETKQALIHFRIKTHGKVSEANCHPFYVTKDLGFIHNGIIAKHGSNAELSDTRDFNAKILKPLVKKFGTTIIQNKEIQTMMKDYIGYSKLVFLDSEGNVTIVNEALGNWNEETWYSNTSWKPYTPLPETKYSKYSRDDWADDDYIPSIYNKKEPTKYTKYYIQKENGDKISEDDIARIGLNDMNLTVGDIVKVIYIQANALCDIRLPSGKLLQNIPGKFLWPNGTNLITVNNNGNKFDDSFPDTLVKNNFWDY